MIWRVHAALDCVAESTAPGQIGQLHVMASYLPRMGSLVGFTSGIWDTGVITDERLEHMRRRHVHYIPLVLFLFFLGMLLEGQFP